MKTLVLLLNMTFLLFLSTCTCSSSPAPRDSSGAVDTSPYAIARLDIVPYQVVNSNFNIGVVAFQKDGIARVDFVFTDNVNTVRKSVTTMTLNSRTGVEEYWTVFDPGQFSDGEVVITATAIPATGTSNQREVTTTLFANSGGAFNNITTYYVGGAGANDTNSGTQGAPFATIAQGFYALGTSANQGRIVIQAEGTYEFGELNKNQVSQKNTGWITVEGEGSLNRDAIIIANYPRNILRPHVDKIKFKHLSFNLEQLGQIYGNYASVNSAYWFDDCKFYLSSGWTNEYSGITIPVRGAYYVTDSTAIDTVYAFPNAKLVRGCVLEKISGDCLQNSEFIVNITIDNVDGTVLTHHTDLYQMFGAMDNVIMYKVTATNLNETQSFFLEPTYMSAPGNPQYVMTNSAFVDCDFTNNLITNGSYTNWGGPPFSQMLSRFSHIIFKNIRLPNQRFFLRNDVDSNNQAWFAVNVIFDNVELHWANYDEYIDTSSDDYIGPPEGVTFINCYTAKKK